MHTIECLSYIFLQIGHFLGFLDRINWYCHVSESRRGDAFVWEIGECRELSRSRSRLSKKPAPPDQEWQDLFEALLMLVRSHAVECEVLRERVQRLEKRLGEVEAERDASDRIAGTLYEFFSRTTQRVAKQKRASEKGSNGGWTMRGGPEAGLPGPGPRRK